MLNVTWEDCRNFGMKRYRQRCKTGRDWIRYFPRKNENFVPPIYRELFDLLEIIFSLKFGLMCEKVEMDVDMVRFKFLEAIGGPSDDDVLHRN